LELLLFGFTKIQIYLKNKKEKFIFNKKKNPYIIFENLSKLKK